MCAERGTPLVFIVCFDNKNLQAIVLPLIVHNASNWCMCKMLFNNNSPVTVLSKQCRLAIIVWTDLQNPLNPECFPQLYRNHNVFCQTFILLWHRKCETIVLLPSIFLAN